MPLLIARGAQKLRRLPSLELLEAFLAVTEHGHVGRAGRALGLSQPAMSARLARLEEDLGTRLFTRIGRALAPTPEARALAPRLRAVLGDLVVALGEGAQPKPEITLRLGTLPTFSSHLFPSLLAARAAGRVVVHHALTAALVDDLRRGTLDLIVGAGPPPRDPRLVVARLGEIVPVAVCANHGPSLPRRISANALRTRRLAMVPRADEPFFDGVRRWIDTERLAPRIVLTVPHLQSLIAVAAASDVVTIVPSYMVAGDARVRARPVDGLDLRVAVWTARKERDPREEVAALTALLEKVGPALDRAARPVGRRTGQTTDGTARHARARRVAR